MKPIERVTIYPSALLTCAAIVGHLGYANEARIILFAAIALFATYIIALAFILLGGNGNESG